MESRRGKGRVGLSERERKVNYSIMMQYKFIKEPFVTVIFDWTNNPIKDCIVIDTKNLYLFFFEKTNTIIEY